MIGRDGVQSYCGSIETRNSTNKQEVDSAGEHGKCVSWPSFLSLEEGMVCVWGASMSEEECLW